MRSQALIPLATTALLALLGTAGCDFFQELESLPEAGGGEESGEDSGTEGEGGEGTPTDLGDGQPCTTLDDVCLGQDSLISCDPETAELKAHDCGTLCAQNGQLNFTCSVLSVDTGLAHGCWCSSPNNVKIDACNDVDQCIFNCGAFPDLAGECTEACLSRTDASTIRLLGSLYHCADLSCDAACAQDPFSCMDCVLSARAGLYGDCALERAFCDSDTNDDIPWP